MNSYFYLQKSIYEAFQNLLFVLKLIFFCNSLSKWHIPLNVLKKAFKNVSAFLTLCSATPYGKKLLMRNSAQ